MQVIAPDSFFDIKKVTCACPDQRQFPKLLRKPVSGKYGADHFQQLDRPNLLNAVKGRQSHCVIIDLN
jgi:hypothetical protein